MQSVIITYLALQLTLLQLVSCQQFTFNNPQIPARFLVPGGFAVPGPNQQGKRLLAPSPQPQPQSQSGEDEGSTRFRKPIIRTRPAIDPPTHGFAFGPESAFNSDQTPRIPPAQDDSSSVLQSESEDQTEETFSSPLSTFEPTPINTVPLRTLKPSTFQPRPTARPPSPPSPPFIQSSTPQSFYRPNINQLEDDEGDDDTNLDTSPSPVPSTEGTAAPPRRPLIDNTLQQFPRRPSPIHRINTIQSKPSRIQPQQQPLPSEFADNKIVRQYEKVPAKTKFEKSEVPEKRGKKPVAQVLKRYRDDNPDGSITWGFENDDGSYKEETIGNDCITRGKYGYIDPDGVRREYTYSQGLLCDKTKTDQEDEEKQSGGYIDYAHNKVVLANGESVDMNNMVKNRQRKPANLRVTRSKVAVPPVAESVDTDTTGFKSAHRQRKQA